MSEEVIIAILTSKESSLYQFLEENDQDFKTAIERTT